MFFDETPHPGKLKDNKKIPKWNKSKLFVYETPRPGSGKIKDNKKLKKAKINYSLMKLLALENSRTTQKFIYGGVNPSN